MNYIEIEEHFPSSFPTQFNYVFWNAPNSWTREEKCVFIERLWEYVAIDGKLIVAVYFGRQLLQSDAEFLRDKAEMEQKINDILSCADNFDRVLINSAKTNHAIAVKIRNGSV